MALNKDVDENFAKRLHDLMEEQLTYGKQLTPVQQASWPAETPNNVPPEETPSTGQTTVTNGDTTPLGAPRDDLTAQNGGAAGVNPEAMGEIASLLISIGYILSKEGVLPDKFNMQGTVKFLSDKFNAVCPPITQDAPPEGVDAPPEGVDAPVEPVDPNAGVGDQPSDILTYNDVKPYMEARKLLESRFSPKKK